MKHTASADLVCAFMRPANNACALGVFLKRMCVAVVHEMAKQSAKLRAFKPAGCIAGRVLCAEYPFGFIMYHIKSKNVGAPIYKCMYVYVCYEWEGTAPAQIRTGKPLESQLQQHRLPHPAHERRGVSEARALAAATQGNDDELSVAPPESAGKAAAGGRRDARLYAVIAVIS
jgi:hypothetical protein